VQYPTSNRHLLPVASALVFVMAFLSVLAITLTLRLQDARLEFNAELERVERRVVEIQQGAEHLLDALAAAYQALDSFDSSRLTSLTTSLADSRPAIELILFAPWVSEDQRDAFVDEMVEGGYPGFVLDSRQGYPMMQDTVGNLPVKFVEPYSPRNVVMLGRDLISDEAGAGELRLALLEGRARVLNNWTLPTKSGGLIYLAKPTFRGLHVPETADQRFLQANGFFVLAMHAGRLTSLLQAEYPDATLLLSDSDTYLDIGIDHWITFGDSWTHPLQVNGALPMPGKIHHLEMQRLLSIKELLPALSWAMTLLLASGAMLLFRMLQFRHQAKLEFRLKEQAVQEERKRAQGTLQSLSDAVLVTDDDGKVLYRNPVADRLLGVELEGSNQKSLAEALRFVDAKTREPLADTQKYLSGLLEGKGRRDVLLVTEEEGLVAVDNRISRLNADGYGGLVMVMRDVRVERELTDRLQYQATHDMLTGLWNRNAFEGKVNETLAQVQVTGDTHSLLFIDLDRFKLVNDTAGHQAGDELLKSVANVLSAGLRSEDILARMGGDEFAVLLHRHGIDLAADVATRLRRSLENLRFNWEGALHEVQASIGVVPIIPESGSLVDLMAHADLACHAAKEAGRNSIHVYRPNDEVVSTSRAQMQLLNKIQDAIDHNRFELYRQPMRSTGESSEPVIYEFLLRMFDESGKMTSPGVFLPAAERYDMMHHVDNWVVERAFQLMADPQCMPPGSICTINLSGQSLSNEELYPHIVRLRDVYGVDPRRVCFEVTETAAIRNMAAASELLASLRKEGYRIMLDDFGAGMSSFGYLNKLKVDFIKIDGQFVCDVVKDPLAASMVRMVCEIAELLQVKTVAEKIESEEVLRHVSNIGVDYVQGFHVQRPEPVPQQAHFVASL